MSFVRRLEARARRADTLLCVGIDPHPDLLPEPTPRAARAFGLGLVEATAGAAAAFKPNIAFYEALGSNGLTALRDVIQAVPDDIPVIVDAKRGDIASTAQAYARAVYDRLGADAVTVSPYLGVEALEPFLRPGTAVFVLCRTSNSGAADIQEAMAGGERVYERVARMVMSRPNPGDIGLVVGATAPDALARVRALAPTTWILSPGVGAQGADLGDALHSGLRADGLGMLMVAARSIAGAPDPGGAAHRLRDDINAARADPGRAAPRTDALDRLAAGLFRAGCVRFGHFTLKSGASSPVYIDLRRLSSHPALLADVAAAYGPLLDGLAFDHLAALPYAALPIGTAIALQNAWSLIYPRRLAKSYGTRALVEGDFEAGQQAVVIDDLATTGDSKLEAIAALAAEGVSVRDVVVLIDRQSGAKATLEAAGCRLHTLFTLEDLVDRLRRLGLVEASDHRAVLAHLAG